MFLIRSDQYDVGVVDVAGSSIKAIVCRCKYLILSFLCFIGVSETGTYWNRQVAKATIAGGDGEFFSAFVSWLYFASILIVVFKLIKI